MQVRLRTIRQNPLFSITHSFAPPFKNFGVSAFNALQVLTDLMAAKPAPPELVYALARMPSEICPTRGCARELLHEASPLEFSRASAGYPWKGSVSSQEQVPDVLERS